MLPMDFLADRDYQITKFSDADRKSVISGIFNIFGFHSRHI
jgi:hypothetical protein